VRATAALVLVAVAAVLVAGACKSGSGAESSPTAGPASPTADATPTPGPAPTATPAPATPTSTPQTEPPPASEPPEPPPATAVGLLTVVDKQHGLSPSYVPPDLTSIPSAWAAPGFGGLLLRAEAASALVKLLEAARDAGHEVRVRSAYRSYDTQVTTFQYWIDQLGEAEARRVSAPPGHSEHQLGTAVDLTSASVGWDLVEALGSTAEGKWLAAQAHKYGFALSYPQGAEAITGYAYEPWHFRYIGVNSANAWAASGLTLVEYLEQVAG
jgi:D-alanyl-D-alanine carboxypeptidase